MYARTLQIFIFTLTAFSSLCFAEIRQSCEPSGLRAQSSPTHMAYYDFVKACKDTKAPEGIQNTVSKLKLAVDRADCLDAFSELRKKKFLVLRYSEITSLEPLASFPQLTELSIGGNEITDITPLASLTQLKKLNLGGLLGYNKVSDLKPLKDLRQLESCTSIGTVFRTLAPLLL